MGALVEHWLLNDFVGSPQHRLRDRQPERLRGLEVNRQLELRGLLDGEIGGLRAFEDLVHELGCAVPKGGGIPAIGN